MSQASTEFEFAQLLKNLSGAPGVYVMTDQEGRYLYVGKARNLKKRVASYFRETGLSPKTTAMMSHVADIQTIVTHTESEALLLENNLIKSERPRYNIVFRDDKSYPYIYLSTNHPFPRLSFYRGARSEAGRYFGPYPSAAAVRETLAHMQKVFPIRQCEDTFFRHRSRPCLQYQINRCSAPCVGFIDEPRYREDVSQAVLFLEGRDHTLNEHLAGLMETAAADLDFETAARYRDRIAALQRVQEQQYVDRQRGDVDIVALAMAGGEACVEICFIRGGRNLGAKHLFPAMSLETTEVQALQAFLPQYYLGKSIPPEILISHRLPQVALLEEVFSDQSDRKVQFKVGSRGVRRRWLQMAQFNADDALRRRIADRASLARRFEALRDELEIDAVPARIECFDTSHTAGEATVASCVVFDMNGAVKSDYRRFNINGIAAGDDYSALSQALTRRYKRLKEGQGKMPDLLLIDGGKGQLGVARTVLTELQIEALKVVAVAKGRSRKPGFERLFIDDLRRARTLPSTSPALHLIQQIRDEAHRFAITGHRQRRGKARVTSRLNEIPGIGDKRRQALLRQLGGLREVARAGVDDLLKVPGISPVLARRIYAVFHDAEH